MCPLARPSLTLRLGRGPAGLAFPSLCAEAFFTATVQHLHYFFSSRGLRHGARSWGRHAEQLDRLVTSPSSRSARWVGTQTGHLAEGAGSLWPDAPASADPVDPTEPDPRTCSLDPVGSV